MKLQLALDRLSWGECFRMVEKTEKSVDIIEIGTGVIKNYGMAIVWNMKKLYPEKTILADMKTCDAGRHETILAFENGADITTVMAFSSHPTIIDTLDVAKQMDKRVMIDLLEVTSKDRIAELHELGVDLVSLHVGKDQQQEGNFDTSLFSLVKGFGFEVTVAGGINLETLPDIIQEKPDTVIVGSAITNSENPQETAAKMKNMIHQSQ